MTGVVDDGGARARRGRADAPPAGLPRRGAPRERRPCVLQPQGWLPGRNVVMPHRGPTAAPPPPPGAREVEPEELHGPKREVMRLDPLTRPEHTMAQLLAADAVVGEVANERCFGYVADGAWWRSAASTPTAPRHRSRTSRPSRHTAAAASRERWCSWRLREAWAAHDFVFIEADAARLAQGLVRAARVRDRPERSADLRSATRVSR